MPNLEIKLESEDDARRRNTAFSNFDLLFDSYPQITPLSKQKNPSRGLSTRRKPKSLHDPG